MISFSTRRHTGRSFYDKGVYPDDFTDEFKEYIRKRDGNRCSICGHKKKPREPELDVHHINYRKNTRKTNCIALCRDCHTVVHFDHGWRWRDWWRFRLYCLAQHREKEVRMALVQKKQLIHEMREVMREERNEYQTQRNRSS